MTSNKLNEAKTEIISLISEIEEEEERLRVMKRILRGYLGKFELEERLYGKIEFN